MEQLREDRRYTYADYCTWDDGERWEIIDGVPYKMFSDPVMMSPAPKARHQSIILEIAGQLRNFLKGKPCKAFIAPFDVRLDAKDDDDTVVQPDISVVCDRSKIDDKGCNGAPDMVVEVLSPSSARHDKLVKFNAYQRAGVREYWIVDPDSKTVAVYLLEGGRFIAAAYGDTDTVPVSVLAGCEINLGEVFED